MCACGGLDYRGELIIAKLEDILYLLIQLTSITI